MKSLLSNLNTRLMIIDLIAFWLFFYAFQTLAFLHDHNFLFLDHMARMNSIGRQDSDLVLVAQAGNFGLIAAYVISWFVANKRNWHWLNGVIVFIVAFTLANLRYFGWGFLGVIFQAPGKIFAVNSIWGFITDAVIMIGIGLLLLLSKRVIRYIDGNKADKNAPDSGKKKPKRTR
jgi:hypothetical protein